MYVTNKKKFSRYVISYVISTVIWYACTSQSIKPWNGCINYSDLEGTNFCFNVSDPMDGEQAWGHCSTFSQTDAESLQALKRVLNSTGRKRVWAGFRESYWRSREFVGPETDYHEKYSLLGPSGLVCLAFNFLNDHEVERESCSDRMPIVCKQEKYRTEAYEASSPEACGVKGAVALLTLPGCFLPKAPCNTFFLRIRPNNMRLNMSMMKVGTPTDVQVLEYLTPNVTYQRPNVTLAHSTKYCYKPLNEISVASPHRIRLELRKNRTAGGFSLWIQHPFRMKWPPKCVGGYISDDISSIVTVTALRNGSLGETSEKESIWCSVLDVVSGKYFTSNIVELHGNSSCPKERLIAGAADAEVDPEASCLRCLKIGLTSCATDSCTTQCEDAGCGPFKLTKRHWSLLHSSFDDFVNCSMDHRCSARIVWKLAERSKDCNGDGFIDCDDIFSTVTSTCITDTNATNRFPYEERERYWNCRHGNESSFVDFAVGEATVRYFCVNKPDGNIWSRPIFLQNETSYVKHNLSFSSIELPQKHSPVTKDEMVQALKGIKRINTTLNSEETKEFVTNISKIFHTTNVILTEAREKANVSSLRQIIENGMLYVKEETNIVTPKVALSKFSSIGALLLSETSTNRTAEEFEKNHTQVQVNSTEEINKYENKIEAGIILSGYDIHPDVKFVVMIFADDKEMFPNTDDNKSTTKEEGNGKVTLNSHVITALLQNGSTHIKLPENAESCTLLPARKQEDATQQKCCAYQSPGHGDRVWKTDGCKLVSSNDSLGLVKCCCNHLSSFTHLLTDAPILTEQQEKHLRIGTVVACIVSILGQLGLLVTGVVYKEWRKKTESQMLLNLAVANICLMSLMLWRCAVKGLPIPKNPCSNEALEESFGMVDRSPPPICWWTGVALHYIVLANFSWMLVCAVTHVLRIYKAPRGPKAIPHYQLLATTMGWTIPIVPVLLIIAIDPAGYDILPKIRTFCYPIGRSFYWGVVAPVGVILALNVVAFVLILHVLFPQCFQCSVQRATRLRQVCGGRKRILRSVVIVWAFTFLFGLTWVLGLLGYHVVTMYAQCAAVMVQGPTIFVIFVLGEKGVRTRISRVANTLKLSRERSKERWDRKPIVPFSTDDTSTDRGAVSNNSVPSSDNSFGISGSSSADYGQTHKSCFNETKM